jgi:tellurite resistance protein TehA-like permease
MLDIWRYIVRRVPLRYDPLHWGAVFPLGMFSVATRHMATALDLPFLEPLPWIIFVAALAAWTLAFAGLLWELRKMLMPGDPH